METHPRIRGAPINMARISLFLLVTLVLQGLFHEQSLAASLVPLVPSSNKVPLVNPWFYSISFVDRPVPNPKQVAAGIEVSDQPFSGPPQLFLNISSALKPKIGKSAVQLAEDLLINDDFKGPEGALVKAAWDAALTRTTADPANDYAPLVEADKKDPLKVAAHVYSMGEKFNGKKLYAEFNARTSEYQVKGTSYKDFPFKGLYALLLQNMQPYTQESYRGVGFPVEVVKNQFIRFNRFASTSFTRSVAEGYAGPEGTLFVIKGEKLANHITPFSRIKSEDEYLMPPHYQFLVLDVNKMNKPTVITIQPAPYSP